MNKKANSTLGFVVLSIGMMIVGFSMYSCVSGGAPYDINEVTACIFSLNKIFLIGIGGLFAFIGACLCGNPN